MSYRYTCINKHHHNAFDEKGMDGGRNIEKVFVYCACACACVYSSKGVPFEISLKYWRKVNVCERFYSFCPFCLSHANKNIATQAPHITKITATKMTMFAEEGKRDAITLYFQEY